MSCVICGKGSGFLGGNIAFTCPVCKKEICKECADKYSNARTFGGIFGDKHAEITCPNCHSVINMR
jgi:rubrerythrin